VDARVVDGKLVMLRVTTVPSAAELSLSPGLSAETAFEIAVAEGPRPDVHHDVEGAVLVVLPSINRVHVEPTLCWVVRTRTAGPGAPGLWVTFVDAETGVVHNVHNQVRFASGTMWATHDTRTVNGDFSTSIVPNARISNGDSNSRTDDNGEWELSGSSFEGVLNGTYFNVKNDDGSEGSLTWSGSDDPTWTDDEATQAEIDSYIFLSQIHDWAEVYASQLDIVDEKMTSNVNLDETCNAYYDGTVNFYQQGNGCNNTARIADVNYHEWGHGMHYSATGTWWLDGSVGEGVGDIVAFLQTGDSTVAPYFMMNGSGIRDVSNDRVYPDDVVGEVHEDGLIFGGAVWDLWEELEDELDADEAYEVLSTIFVEAIEANPDIPGTYDEFMAADDDNADLSDGTPNQCAIIDAFSRHGLGPGSSGSVVELAMEAIDNQDPEETASKGLSGYTVEAEMINLAPECSDAEVLAASVVFSTDGGENWDTEDLGTDGELIWGELPAQDDGSIVHYYIEVETASEGVVTLPRGATINPLSFFVGQLEEIRCDDFEDDDAGYDHDLIDGEEQEGADDWIWGTPLGYADDPDVAASGNMVWGNDLGGGNYNGEYQDSKHNRLTTPSVDVSGYERVVLQFNRWLNVEDGYYDQARVLQGEDTIWTNHESNQSIGDEHHADEQWSPHTVELEVGSGEAVTVSWEIESDGGLSFGGWNIDDVCFYGVIPVETTDDIDDETSPELGSGVSSTDSTASDADFAVCGCSAPAQAASPRAIFAWAIGLAGLVLRRRRQKQDMSF